MPGKISPGFHISTMIPSAPSESISVMMFGSISVSRIRFQNDISIRSISSRAPCELVSPFGFVFVPVELPEERRQSGAIASITFCSQRLAGGEVRRLAHRASAHSTLRPCLSRERADVRGRVVDDLAAQVLGMSSPPT